MAQAAEVCDGFVLVWCMGKDVLAARRKTAEGNEIHVTDDAGLTIGAILAE
jgi:hypothetical protein